MPKKYKKKLPRRKTEAERLWEKISGSYPNCVGSYPECPEKIEDKDNPPSDCIICPVYIEWKNKRRR